eukprot:5807024-Prymnesium_polylepis.1
MVELRPHPCAMAMRHARAHHRTYLHRVRAAAAEPRAACAVRSAAGRSERRTRSRTANHVRWGAHCALSTQSIRARCVTVSNSYKIRHL